tara:strand:- start:707 stop:1864 length:1158 start_codon:yes stop_codon:yes gene_type:complete
LKIQLWRRKNYNKSKYNIYLRYRISQNKAKVESLNLWEWIKPKNKIETEHNKNVKIACDEIIRRSRDDIENNRIKIPLEENNKSDFKFNFFKFSNIKNTEAIYNFIKSYDNTIETKNINQVDENYLNNIKLSIEKNIDERIIKGSTASKYWNNFKTVLINLNKNKLCDYPKQGGIKYKKENKEKLIFSSSEIEDLIKTDINKWKDLKNAFLFSCNTGLKLNIIQKLKWKHIYNIDKENKIYYYSVNNKGTKYINSFTKKTRLLLGQRKEKEKKIFNLPKKHSNRSKIFLEWIKKAKVNYNKKFNDAINTYAYNLYNRTKNIYRVTAALGHFSINKTKEKYNYMNELDYLKKEKIIDIQTKGDNPSSIKIKLFKKGNLLSYRKKDT